MTKQVLFVQGGGARVHDHWDNKLVASLRHELGKGYDIAYPRMPNEDDPHYADWKAALIREFEALKDGAFLVGHSVGATILIHTLAEKPPKARLRGIFLVAAPFIGEGGWPSDEMQPLAGASDLPADVPVFLYRGTEDETVPAAHLQLYQKVLPRAVVHALPHLDHQLNNDLSEVARDIRSLRVSHQGKP